MNATDLENSIDTLTEKLNGIGIEIYHLSSALGSINANLSRIDNAL